MKSIRYGSLKSFVNHFQLNPPVDWSEIFGRAAELEVEIGFGTGEYLVRMAGLKPERNFIGIEENVERIHKTLRKIEVAGLTNIRLLHVDARLAFQRYFQEKSICTIHCLFPCPWPKKNQIKHRLFFRSFLKQLNHRLTHNGQVELVTDHGSYAQWVVTQSSRTGFRMEHTTVQPRFNTKFERKWLEAGQKEFYAFTFTKINHLKQTVSPEPPLKVYFFDEFNPETFHFENQNGTPSVILKEFFFDEQRRLGMVHLLVAEDYLQQHLWAKIVKTAQKGWCLAVADGTLVVPTSGIAKAMETLYGFVAKQ
jgi:tRNA (guanine-N7-)-methyltransferase